MSEITIAGAGSWILSADLDEIKAKEYSESGGMPEEDYERLKEESDGVLHGFYPIANVYLDGVSVGSIEDLVEIALDLKQVKEKASQIKKNYEKKYDVASYCKLLNIKNAFIEVMHIEGIFANGEIPYYGAINGRVKDIFVIDFINALIIDEGAVLNLSDWQGVDLSGSFDSDVSGRLELVVCDGRPCDFSIQDGWHYKMKMKMKMKMKKFLEMIKIKRY